MSYTAIFGLPESGEIETLEARGKKLEKKQ